MNPEQIQAIVTKAAQAVEDGYVFPDKGAAVAATAPRPPRRGPVCRVRRPRATSPSSVTADLRDASGDLHLRLLFHEDGAVGEEDEAALAATVGGAGAPDRRRDAPCRTPRRQHRPGRGRTGPRPPEPGRRRRGRRDVAGRRRGCPGPRRAGLPRREPRRCGPAAQPPRSATSRSGSATSSPARRGPASSGRARSYPGGGSGRTSRWPCSSGPRRSPVVRGWPSTCRSRAGPRSSGSATRGGAHPRDRASPCTRSSSSTLPIARSVSLVHRGQLGGRRRPARRRGARRRGPRGRPDPAARASAVIRQSDRQIAARPWAAVRHRHTSSHGRMGRSVLPDAP